MYADWLQISLGMGVCVCMCVLDSSNIQLTSPNWWSGEGNDTPLQ